MARMCQMPSLVDFATNARFEPFLHDAAPRSDGSNARQTGRSVGGRYAYC